MQSASHFVQVSQDSHFWHVILKVETEQRLTRMPSEVEPHQLEIVDTEVNTTGYVSPLPTVRSPGWLKKKDRRKRPTKEQIRAPPETDFVLRVRSTPYILNNRETAAQFKTELADWKDRKAREEYERDVARHSMGDEAQGTSDPAPEWQTITEYPVFEIHLEPNTTRYTWEVCVWGGALGFGLWACLPGSKRSLRAHRLPLIGEVRLKRTSHTQLPAGQ